jgi:hypothetical protein
MPDPQTRPDWRSPPGGCDSRGWKRTRSHIVGRDSSICASGPPLRQRLDKPKPSPASRKARTIAPRRRNTARPMRPPRKAGQCRCSATSPETRHRRDHEVSPSPPGEVPALPLRRRHRLRRRTGGSYSVAVRGLQLRHLRLISSTASSRSAPAQAPLPARGGDGRGHPVFRPVGTAKSAPLGLRRPARRSSATLSRRDRSAR